MWVSRHNLISEGDTVLLSIKKFSKDLNGDLDLCSIHGGPLRNYLVLDSELFPDLKPNEIKWIRFCRPEWAIGYNSIFEIDCFYKNVDI